MRKVTTAQRKQLHKLLDRALDNGSRSVTVACHKYVKSCYAQGHLFDPVPLRKNSNIIDMGTYKFHTFVKNGIMYFSDVIDCQGDYREGES